MKRVGVLGGGQLGMMLAHAVHRLGHGVSVYEPSPEAPACSQLANVVTAPWTDAKRLESFLGSCDVVTYEMEHVDTTALAGLAESHKLIPAIRVLETAQDRAKEKEFLRDHGLPHAAFEVAHGPAEVREKAVRLGFPLVMKTVRGGYDGKGQLRIDHDEALSRATAALAADSLVVLEELLDLDMELSCIVARDAEGKHVTFPLFENVHEHHVLATTLMPARVATPLADAVKNAAGQTAEALGVTGLLTTEFFVSRSPGRRGTSLAVGDQHLFVNELAPRPHNSGHVTRVGCDISQFDALARILVGAPLASPRLRSDDRSYCMVNLLGDVWLDEAQRSLDLAPLADAPGLLELVLYGKREPRPKRKMGHLAVEGTDPAEAVRRARDLREKLRHPKRG